MRKRVLTATGMMVHLLEDDESVTLCGISADRGFLPIEDIGGRSTCSTCLYRQRVLDTSTNEPDE